MSRHAETEWAEHSLWDKAAGKYLLICLREYLQYPAPSVHMYNIFSKL